MSRPVRYRDADSLFSNCFIRNDCIVWRSGSNNPSPILTAQSPLAQQFATTSVARILFTIVKFPPASTRITRMCITDSCVNPWHHVEAKPFREKRKKQVNPFDDLPEQDSHRHLIAPEESVLQSMKPTDPAMCDVLARSASVAGYDCKGLKNKRFAESIHAKSDSATPADTKPVLVMRSMVEKQKREIEEANKPAVEEEGFDNLYDEFMGLLDKGKNLNTAHK